MVGRQRVSKGESDWEVRRYSRSDIPPWVETDSPTS